MSESIEETALLSRGESHSRGWGGMVSAHPEDPCGELPASPNAAASAVVSGTIVVEEVGYFLISLGKKNCIGVLLQERGESGSHMRAD